MNVDQKNRTDLKSPRTRKVLMAFIALSIVLVTVLHFLTPVEQIVWHEIYQRLYYIPIIAAALLFGLRGGLAASIFTTIVYSPHIFVHWQDGHFNYSINQYAEMVIFNLVGGVMGALGDQLRKAQFKAFRYAEERKTAYDELQKTFEQLLQAEKLSSLGELSAGIVHEVRNPLAAIKGAVEILEDELAADSPRREFAGLAKKEVDRIDKLVGEFLRFARPAELAKAPRQLNEIVESVISLIETQALSKSISINRQLSADLPKVLVDSEHIKQLLLNLAINSIQAMPDSGLLVFRTFREKHHCFLEVEDDGCGIDKKYMPRIFDPFFSTKESGVGLGLSIAHKIAVQHDGKLTAKTLDEKMIFTLQLPAKANHLK